MNILVKKDTWPLFRCYGTTICDSTIELYVLSGFHANAKAIVWLVVRIGIFAFKDMDLFAMVTFKLVVVGICVLRVVPIVSQPPVFNEKLILAIT